MLVGRAWAGGALVAVHPLESKSHLVASLARAQGIGVVGPERGAVEAGEELAVVALVG